MPELDFWIRIDRNRNTKTPHRKASDVSSSIYEAKDEVKVALQEDELIPKRSSCRPLIQSQYPASAQQASVREISKVLHIFSNESTNYVLLTENCWYLAALVQEFVAMDSGNANGDKATRTWAMGVPGGKRKRILKRWNDNRSDTSLVDGVTEVQDESDLGSVRQPSVYSLEREQSTVPHSPADSRQSTVSKASWLFARLPRRSSTAKSGSTQYVDEPESIIPEDSQVQTHEGEPEGSVSQSSHRKSKRSLSSRAMTIITLGKRSSTLTKL